eukprot:CAMPEP_0117080474 /NCGR_PEP_ID=MMETSP0472-20121206/56774_1 /TAXON_ID=693140 ORGANISM="Tiarina fusus, Strain LIS" /NCGR_SAMPLE_ID=MMETSP0472 /ASSEMBLY_ACC=CAM_ASM_000603 /LENGTH=261 /DNA_ID=CAMNT_0004808119 /DNA_START=31 /DNA_END=814 /DNA_ORIENTATION=+
MTYDVSETENNQQLFDHNGRIDATEATGAIVVVQSTEVVELATSFENVLVSKNMDDGDEESVEETIHVGRLLFACEQLERVIRKVGLCFTQSANDIAKNIKKVRNVYDRFADGEILVQGAGGGGDRNAISTIVEYELASGVHTDRKSFAEHSASQGLLWLARSINFQHMFYGHLLENDHAEPYGAAVFAYEAALSPHLPWALQTVGQAALLMISATNKRSIYARIGGFPEGSFEEMEELATKAEMRRVLDAWEPVLKRYRQ